MTSLPVWIATGGPAGYAPVAPGTFGSLIGLAIYFLIARWPIAAQLAAGAAITLIGTWAAGIAARHFNRSDPSYVVVDEIAGQVVTLIGLGTAWTTLLLGFVVFRALDIIKPWPANRLEAMHGGTGIMADDLMAAIYGQVVLRAVIFFIPGLF